MGKLPTEPVYGKWSSLSNNACRYALIISEKGEVKKRGESILLEAHKVDKQTDYSFLKDLLARGVAEGCFPSATAAIGVGNQTFFACAAGDADVYTRFDMASLTKILSPTMIALKALEEGALTLEDPLTAFFETPPDKAAITVEQLMTHTGGFTPAFWLFDETDDPAEAAACILRHPLEAPPDGTPRYSCMGYILLGKILEVVYGQPLDQLAKSRVFEPLGMHCTGYKPTVGNIAPTEVNEQTGEALQGVVHDENARFLGGISGNAGVFSDIGDMALFASMLASGGGGYLSGATLSLAISNHTPGYSERRGLGFCLGGHFMGGLFPHASFGHMGFTGTSLVVDPATGLFAVLLTNRVHPTRRNERIFRFRQEFHNEIFTTCTQNGICS